MSPNLGRAALALVVVVLAAPAGLASGAARLGHPGEHGGLQPEECTADVSGESVMVARCRASCLHKFTSPPPAPSSPSSSESVFVECASQADCMMCWDHCGDRLKGGPEFLASVCTDTYLCWAGCRAACDFHFPYGVRGSPGSAAGGSWSLRPTNEASSAAIRTMPAPYLDTAGLTVRWRQPPQSLVEAATTVATTTTTTTSTPTPSTTTSASFEQGGTPSSLESGESGESDSNEDQYDDDAKVEDSAPATAPKAPSHRRIVYIVSAKMAPSSAWKELKQTTDLWLALSGSTRAAMRAVSVLAVSADGPVARGSACVQPVSGHQQDTSQDGEDYYDEDASDEDDDKDDDSGSSSSDNAIPDASLQHLAQRSFAQLRGTVQHGVLLRALLRDRVAVKQTDEEDEDADDEDEEELLLDQRRLDLVQRLLGAGRARGRGKGRADKGKAAGWGLHLVGVWAAGGGARLPRARVAWTAPRGVAQTEALVSWAVPALRISGSRVVSGVSQAEVPLVEQHATRVTVGDAHSSDVSAALVLQLSVQTDASAAASAAALAPHHHDQDAVNAAPAPAAAPVTADVTQRTAPTYEQAALWEATLVAVGLVVGAAALCVALLLAAYGVHGRVARCCRGRSHGMHGGIHAKSASVEPLNSPDQNNV